MIDQVDFEGYLAPRSDGRDVRSLLFAKMPGIRPISLLVRFPFHGRSE